MTPATDTTPVLAGLSPEEIAAELALPGFRGNQIFQWIHAKKVFQFDAMTDLGKDLRRQLDQTAIASPLIPLRDHQSASGTKKVLFRLQDNETVESVLLRDRDRSTLCISSQVGCPLRCSFCATGLSGYTRNLTPGEIAAQALHLLAGEDMGARTPNIVYMGMGEPFRNYDNVVKSIQLLMHPKGLNIGARKITVSTAGEVPEIRRFAEEPWQVRLSVSLHAADNAKRNILVPLNKRYPLEKLIPAIEFYCDKTGRQMTFEWTLLEGVNDTPDDAKHLAELAAPIKAFVNLIPYNPVSGLPYHAPSAQRSAAFAEMLRTRGVQATLRKERGQDIDAACGQLRRQHSTRQGTPELTE
jgi:23S rRNA (adenine2503-C2)-methyltransferase